MTDLAILSDSEPHADSGAADAGAPPVTDAQLEAVADAIGKNAEQVDAADPGTGIGAPKHQTPDDQPLPFAAPPFDEAAAIERIVRQNHKVASALREYESAKEEATSCKKAWENQVKELAAIIREVEEQQRKYDRLQEQPLLAPVDEPKPTGCSYELRTGRPCPICRKADVSVPVAEPMSEAHDTEAQNVEDAEGAELEMAREADADEQPLEAGADDDATEDLPAESDGDVHQDEPEAARTLPRRHTRKRAH